MKKILFFFLIAVFFSCKVSEKPSVKPHGTGGYIEDDPIKVSKVPLIMSPELKVAGRPVAVESVASRGKPIKIDTAPPKVSITSPANGASVSGTVKVSVSASDNVGVISVSLYINNVYNNVATASPYDFWWVTSTINDGTHVLKAIAIDARGNKDSSMIIVSKNTIIEPPKPPVTFPYDFKLLTPIPGRQLGNECVAFATVYGDRSVYELYKRGDTVFNESTNIFSQQYVYNNTNGGNCAGGTGIVTCLDFMQIKGVPYYHTMPYNGVNGCSLPTAAYDAEAALHKIGTYSKILHTDTTAIKTLLYSNHPIIVPLTLDNAFQSAGPGFIWNFNTKNDGSAPHALLVVGWDNGKQAYKVMNSYGTGWGDGGFSWINYDYFQTVTGYYLYVIN